ncbi:hypothetical protein BRC19_00310 [Candidatus Saccharibacteria bacterium QS_5_54_17]|nr:MAG: hypothetical protein BRC19_00310 [Candidatus Saccharibacteria bacterium QS_5_54_17]
MAYPQFFSDLLAAPAGPDPQVHDLLDDVLGCPGPGPAVFTLLLTPNELPDTDALDIPEPAIDGGPVAIDLSGDVIDTDGTLIHPPGMLID